MMGHRFAAEGLQSRLKDIRYSRSRMKGEDQTPQDQSMARPTHRSRIETGFGILAFSVVFLQKFGFALLGDYIGIDAFILFGVLLWLFIMGDAVIDLTRFVLYGTLFLSVCLSLFLSGHVPSVPSVTVMLGMYFSFLFRVNTDHQTMLRCINKFQVCMVWIAIIILL